MPTLLDPPITRPRLQTRPRPLPALELPAVSFFGRTLDEYARFFALDVAALRGLSVLDVAAGPSSFTAEACRRGIDAVAVDPQYSKSGYALSEQITRDYDAMFAQIRAKRRLFKLKSFSSLEAAEEDRRTAAQRFVSDFETHAVHGRYVAAALPRLPFFDGTFDLVLCAHLLFIYAQQFDFEWHLAACRELARVSTAEVRIHPIVGADGRLYPELERLRRELLARGVTSRVQRTDYEFFAGSTSTLILNPQQDA
ncbi:MAG: class I SAM-dependent methyltransferase [Opitutus sp.]|nr:class I SAM-dependent methyltransferase [Opitutus sp.]